MADVQCRYKVPGGQDCALASYGAYLRLFVYCMLVHIEHTHPN